MSAEDGLVSASAFPTKLGESLSLRWGASLSLPLSEDSRERASLRTTLTLGPTLSLAGAALGLPRLSLSFRPSLARAFHAYTVSTTGRSNTAWALSQRLDLGWAFTERLQLSLVTGFSTTWTYAGEAQSSFRSAQELGLQVTPELSLEVGHSNGGSLYRPDGETSNIALFNRNSSRLYGGLTYVL